MHVTAAVLRERGQPFVIEELELEEPRDDEVLVRVVGRQVDVVDAIRSITAGGADYALETAGAGSPALVRQAVECLTIPGVCGLVGAAPPEMEVTLRHQSLFWGRAVRGIIEGDSVPHLFIPALVELHARGRFPLERLISFYPLHDINRAAAGAEDGVVVKPVLRPST